MFTARNRQNPFAARRRRAAEAEAEAEAEAAPPVAAPVDLNPDSEEYTQAPDISTYATGGIVGQAVIGEPSPNAPLPDAEDVEREAPAVIEISADTQAKIDAVLNHAIPPVPDEPTTSDELIASITDPGPAPIAEPQTPPDNEPKRGRGRPRPQETIDRDNAVHALLVKADADTGISKEEIAVKLDGEKEQQVYSSLRQLTKEGRAKTRYVKGHGYRWFAV